MPGLLPHIQIGTESGLGKAIAELTGLAPLRGMVRHARQVKKRIEKEVIDAYLDARDAADTRFLDSRKLLEALILEHPVIAPTMPLTVLPTTAEADHQLDSLVAHVRDLQEKAYADAGAVLGDGFVPTDARMRQQLEDRVGPALAALDLPAIARLTNAARLGGLGKLTPDQIGAAEAKAEILRREAVALRDLAASPSLESRMRLYVRVANWLRETGHTTAPDACPVCSKPFGTASDPVTERPVHEHVAEALDDDRVFLEKTLASWAESAAGALVRDLSCAVA